MKKFVGILLVLVLLLSALPAYARTSEVMSVVNCNEYVSLRKTPDTKASVLEKVHLGEFVTYCSDAENGFIRCDFNGKTGYILSQYLADTLYSNTAALMFNQQVVNCEEYVSLREYPDTKSARLEKVPKGAIVTNCVNYEGTWVMCSYKGKEGFILSQYLTKADYSKPVGPTPTPKIEEEDPLYPILPYYMSVTNCSEWVTLRDRPSTTGKQLERVPLGAQVEDCVQVSEDFVRCVYNGIMGYIRLDMLTAEMGFDVINDLPDLATFMSVGNTVLAHSEKNGYTVLVQHVYSSNREEIMAVCYNNSMQPVWSIRESNNLVGQVDSLGAFIAGTDEYPVLVIARSGYGLTAYNITAEKQIAWVSSGYAAMNISGGITAASENDGTMYVIGYFNDAPTCFNADGSVRWTATNTDSNIYWPFAISVENNSISVYYDSAYDVENGCYKVTYSKSGMRTGVSTVSLDSIPKGITY